MLQYNLEDAFTTFDGIKNTPRYWQKVKYDMIAKLENIGPFNIFYTLSCGDSRYSENFSSFLAEMGYKMEYTCRPDGSQETIVIRTKDGVEIKKELSLFLEEDVDESLHEMIRTNVLTATRNFNHQLESFKKEIMMGHNNPMKIKHMSYRIEFQGRGAAHAHGTLWLDIKRIEELILSMDCGATLNPGDLSNAFEKFRYDIKLTANEKHSIQIFTDMFITCSLNPDTVHDDKAKGKRIVNIVEEVNCHHCTNKCKTFEGKCKYGFPRFPLKNTLVIDKNEEKASCKEDALEVPTNDKYKKILNDVEETLKDNEIIEFIMKQYPKGSTKEQYHENMSKRIDLLLQISGEIKYEDYIAALRWSRKYGSIVLLKRDVDEGMINNYNTEWALAWNANHDIQPVLDYFAVITYVTDYWSKSDEGVTQHLKEAAANLKSEKNQQKKCQQMANTFLTHRQMSECEAYYKILPNLHLKFSSIDTVFIPTDKRELRSRFLRKLDEDDENIKHGGKVMGGREGLFIEKSDIVDKYCRRQITEENPELEEMTLMQFARMYQPVQKKKDTDQYEWDQYYYSKDSSAKIADQDYHWIDDEDRISNYYITINSSLNYTQLPNIIRLRDCQPGEVPIWKKRTFPKAARFHRKREDNDPHRYFLSELMLYKGFTNELEIGSQDETKCRDLYTKHKEDLHDVKHLLLPFAKGVEEARYFVEAARREENEENLKIGTILDAEKEQEIIECQDAEEIHPDFAHLDPDALDIESNNGHVKKSFRHIQLDNKNLILENTRKLDRYQKQALHIALKYAQDVVIARKGIISHPKPPLLFVHGGAGSGKSTLIHLIYQNVQSMLQKEGDDPDCPYVLLSAYTGTAAANINGQTLHTLFSFNFGAGYISLSDKTRDEKRNLYKNLKMLIIDEISLVDADMFYKIDLRLREITNKQVTMGNVAVIVLGDLMQMCPITGRYIFLKPRDTQFGLSHEVDPLWNKFHYIALKENHRQGEDKDYADMLNRIRVGDETEADIQKLKERVRNETDKEIKDEKDALFIYGTNKNVNKMNNRRLKELKTEEHIIKAICLHRTIKDFDPPEGKHLKLKIGAKVMLTYNVDTSDGLTNGARGDLVGFWKDSKSTITKLIIKFENNMVGQEKRRISSHITAKYPFGTPIEKVNFSFSISRSAKSVVNTASVIQFPVKLAFACTAHKVQGLTVAKPQKVVINVNDTFAAAMVYVMISRVCAIIQIFILNEFNETKMYPNVKALNELKRLEEISSEIKNDMTAIKIYSLNCRSLNKHYEDILSDSEILQADLICLQETWLEDNSNWQEDYKIPHFFMHPNSYGRGKGIVIYYKNNNRFHHDSDIKDEYMQLSKFCSSSLDVITIYRSQNACHVQLIRGIKKLITLDKPCLVIGNFNFCYQQPKTQTQNFFTKYNFIQFNW